MIGLHVAGAPPIGIKADGTYEWVIDSKTTVRGQWRLAAQSELKYGYDKRGTTILLERGEDGKNWLVSRTLGGTSDGQDKILIERVDLGLSYSGGRMPGTKAVAPVKRPAGLPAAMLQTVSLGNGALDHDSSKWTAEVRPGSFLLAHKSGKGPARFTALPAVRSARVAAESALEAMKQNILKLKLVDQNTRMVRGFELVMMRMQQRRTTRA